MQHRHVPPRHRREVRAAELPGRSTGAGKQVLGIAEALLGWPQASRKILRRKQEKHTDYLNELSTDLIFGGIT